MAKKTTKIKNQLEPKRKNLFKITFPQRSKIKNESVIGLTRPIWVNGKGWKNMSITFIDTVAQSMSQCLLDMKDKKNFKINLFSTDPTGATVESWTIKVESVQSINFGKNDISSSEVSKVILTLKIESCLLNF